jgi:Sec7 domain/PH domain
LTASGFRLPGEAQRIDRVVETFSQCFFEDNAGDMQRCPFKDQDTVFLLVFAIIMLNTDLHKADPKSKKSNKKMTKNEFANNLKGAILNEALGKDYLSDIYDSILAQPIAMHDDAGSVAGASQSDRIEEMLKSIRGSDSLLRGLAVHDFQFVTIEDFTDALAYTAKDALSDLTCSCVSKTWYQWHGIINTCLETAHLDPQGMEPAIDILLYSLVVTTCLQMPVERNAFVSQLVRFRTFEERRQGRWFSTADQSHREEQWYLELDKACSGTPAAKLQALKKIHNQIQNLKNALRVDVRTKAEMTAAVGELENGDFLLLDPTRSFLKSDDLIKKSSRTGRATEYRFYLFSDVLIYASREDNGRYRIHEELPLHLMKVTDWFPPPQKNRQIMFEIHHPRKSFRVLCPSSDARKSWVEQIRASILMELEHKMVMENARLSEVVARGTSLAT